MLASLGWLVGEYVANKNLLVNGDGRITGTFLVLHTNARLFYRCFTGPAVCRQECGNTALRGFVVLQVLRLTTFSRSNPREEFSGSPLSLLLVLLKLGALVLAGRLLEVTISTSFWMSMTWASWDLIHWAFALQTLRRSTTCRPKS